MQINIFQAKNNLSSLIVAAEKGEEIVIARNGRPVVKLIKYTAPKVSPPGIWKNQIEPSIDWDSSETNTEIELLFSGSDNASAT
jgi:prevent-host-death family protein